MTRQHPTIGLLYPGEMGASFAALLAGCAGPVVTTLNGRGEQTRRRCAAAGIEALQTLAHVATRANIVFSFVPPAAAAETAEAYCEVAHLAPAGALYVDVNSIGPELVVELSRRVEQCGVGFVDGAINGLAKNLASNCTMFVSGIRAPEVADLLGSVLRVQVLGDQPGRASAMKMLLSGLSKGVCALFVETALIAQRNGMLKVMTEAYTRIYPGVMGIVERMLPTYPQHAGRRADEMRELEQTAEASGLQPCMIAAARRVHELLASTEFGTAAEDGWTVQSIIERLALEEFLFAENFAMEKCHGQ